MKNSIYKIKVLLMGLLFGLLMATAAHSNAENTFKVIGSQTASAGMLSTDVQIAFELLFNDVLDKTGEKVGFSVYEDFSTVQELFTNDNTYDAVYTSSVEFVKSELFDLLDEDTLITSTFGNTKKRRIFIVAKSDSRIKKLADAKSKVIAFDFKNDLIELYLNTLAINHENVLAKKYFKTMENKTNGSESIISLFFGNTDVVAVFEDEYNLALELNPQLQNQLSIIGKSDYLISAVVGIRNDGVDEETKNLFMSVALNMNKHKRGKKMLEMYGATKFTKLKIEELNAVQEMYSAYINYKNQ